MNSKIFEIVSKVSTPMGFAGILAIVLFYVIQKIITKKQIQGKLHNDTINRIIDKLFHLAMVAMFLGFVGWIIIQVYAPKQTTVKPNAEFSFNVLDYNGEPIPGVEVTICNLRPRSLSTMSTRDGEVRLSFDTVNKNKLLHIKFLKQEFNIHEIKIISIDSFPLFFNLSTIP